MIFKTMEDYKNKINEINQKIKKYSKYVELHPDEIGVKGNLDLMIFVRDALLKEMIQNEKRIKNKH